MTRFSLNLALFTTLQNISLPYLRAFQRKIQFISKIMCTKFGNIVHMIVYLYQQNEIKMTNLVSKIANQDLVKNYGITEAFFYNGEFYITSNYDLHYETIAELENELSNK